VLSDAERRVLAELEQALLDEGWAPRRERPHPLWSRVRLGVVMKKAPAALAGIAAVLLFLNGAPSAAVALCVAGGLIWGLCHWWPRLKEMDGLDGGRGVPCRSGGPER
jgi:hypothetical protein